MNDLVPTSPSKKKGFLSSPEAWPGVGIPLILGAAVIYVFGSSIGDFIVNAVDNMLHLTVVVTALFAMLWVLFDPKFRTFAFYLYRSLMRWMTGKFIELDPIGILKTYKERMEGKLGEMREALDKLKAQKVKVQRLLENNKKDLDNTMRRMQQAAKIGDLAKQSLEGKHAANRLEPMQQRYLGDLNRITLLATVLDRYYGLCQDTITDMEREIKFRQDEREYSQASRNVVASAMSILKGLPEKEMWDEGLETLERQYTEAIGEVENFLDVTRSILEQADLQDGADAQKAMEMLDAWQQKNAGVSLGGSQKMVKADIIKSAQKQLAAPSNVINIGFGGKPDYAPATLQGSGDDDYLSMLK